MILRLMMHDIIENTCASVKTHHNDPLINPTF